MSNIGKKLAIPAEFSVPSTYGTVLFTLYMLSMFLLPAIASCWLILGSALPLWLSIPLSLPLLLLSGQGMHLMGWMGHDGLHFNLHENRIASSIIGIFFSAGSVFFLEMGMALDHWTHHRYTNQPEDPDLVMFKKYRGLWERMLFSRLRSNRHYVRRVWKLISNQPLDQELRRIILPFSLETIRRLALFNVFCNLLWALAFLALASFNWKIFIIVFLVPMVFASFLSGLRPYIEHNGTDADEFNNTRTRTSLMWTVLDLGANYHLEHHLYPNVPQWRLPALHRYLASQGFKGGHYDDTHFAHYRYATRRFQYPGT